MYSLVFVVIVAAIVVSTSIVRLSAHTDVQANGFKVKDRPFSFHASIVTNITTSLYRSKASALESSAVFSIPHTIDALTAFPFRFYLSKSSSVPRFNTNLGSSYVRILYTLY